MLTKIPKTVPVAELRRNLAKYLNLSSSEPVVVSAGRGDGARVLLDSELYNHLLEAYEDQRDADVLRALREEQEQEQGQGEVVSWAEVKFEHGL